MTCKECTNYTEFGRRNCDPNCNNSTGGKKIKSMRMRKRCMKGKSMKKGKSRKNKSKKTKTRRR
jgi:hypothetical protein